MILHRTARPTRTLIANDKTDNYHRKRQVFPDRPDNHKLETLVRYKNLKTEGVHHRALADAEMTAHLWLQMITDIRDKYGLEVFGFGLMQQLMKVPRKKVGEFILKHARS